MRRFLEQFNEREPHDRKETIEQLPRWIEVEADGGTADPAQWHDWIGAIRAVLAGPTRAARRRSSALTRRGRPGVADASHEDLPVGHDPSGLPTDCQEGVRREVMLRSRTPMTRAFLRARRDSNPEPSDP